MSLRAPHYGYAYQDLITGFALVDLVLGTAESVTVDTKGFPDDRFDDLTVCYRTGRRTRIQIKHTTLDRQLSNESFSQDKRSLRLDALFENVLMDLDQHPETTYRVVVRDGVPTDTLGGVLKRVGPDDDPGDPLPGLTSQRYRFEAAALKNIEPWESLLNRFSGEQISLACERLTIDTGAPASTLNFADPGPAERALLHRATEDLGAGRVPNMHVAPDYVALALTHAATAARAKDGQVHKDSILPRIGLITDFGAVAEGHPIEPAVEVHRAGAVAALQRQIELVSPLGGRVVVLGEPGVGKSWLCEQLATLYGDDHWIVARHHCWLGLGDSDRDRRVLTEVVIGSLLHQIEIAVPASTANLRPRFSATVESLGAALRASRDAQPEQRVLVIVDGLDHVDRVLGPISGRSANSARILVEQLATVDLPPGVCMLIASQPGEYLTTLRADREILEVPRMSREEIVSLSSKHGLFDGLAAPEAAADGDKHAVIDLLYERCGGNALYATYLCRFAASASPLAVQPQGPFTIKSLLYQLNMIPASASDVEAYYAHLLNGMSPDQELAIGILALCNFAVSIHELKEIIPSVGPLLEVALAKLAPVLRSQPGLGGLRIHHESFSRHILKGRESDWVTTIRESAAHWLAKRGFFEDTRAFRHLPRLLANLNRYDELKKLMEAGFVAKSIYSFQPPSALVNAVEVLALEAEKRLDWPQLVACIETRKAIDVYESESLIDSIVEYAGAVVSIVGADIVAERLLYDGRPTFPARWGLLICEAVDDAGAAAPWREYIDDRQLEAARENTRYGGDSDAALARALQLGALRLSSQRGELPADLAARVASHLDLSHQVPLEDLVEVFTKGLPMGTMAQAAYQMMDAARAARVLISLADLAAAGTPGLPSPAELAHRASTIAPAEEIDGCLRHGVPAGDVITNLGIVDFGVHLKAATNAIVHARHADYEGIREWLSLITLAHAFDPPSLLRIASETGGDGFYRAWLRYSVATVGIADDVTLGRVSADAASAAVKIALAELGLHAQPFTGQPRACDLYSIHSLVHDVIERSLRVVQPPDLDDVLDSLLLIDQGTTTTTNFGLSENGPLAANDLLAILSRVSDCLGISAVHRMVHVVRERRSDIHSEYRIMADFELAVAAICNAAGADQEASECWRRASDLLASYGGHKDPTISEILHSVHDISDFDKGAARRCLADLVDLVYLVRQHTNGRGTTHFVEEWWRVAAAVDPSAAAIDGTEILLSEIGLEDARVHAALTQLLVEQVQVADAVALAALRLAVGANWRDPAVDVVILRRLANELGQSPAVDAVLAIVANNVAATYDDQPMSYSSGQPTAVSTRELIDAVVNLGGPVYQPRALWSEPEKRTLAHDPQRDTGNLLERLEASQPPALAGGRAGVIEAASEYVRRRRSNDVERWGLEAAANAIGWRIVEAVEANGAAAGIELLDDVDREIGSLSDNEILAAIGEGLSVRCGGPDHVLRSVASYCLSLAYARIRGGGGWRSFAGRERVDLWTKAHALDPATAEGVLASALADVASRNALGTYGVTQGVVAALAATHSEQAIACWSVACNVISRRLPGVAELSGHEYRPTLAPESQSATDASLATLAVAAISQPMRVDLRLALVALALLLVCRPTMGQAALARVLRSDLDAGRITWLLDATRISFSADGLSDELVLELERLARSEWLSVRARVVELLRTHRQTRPSPPANKPLPAVSAAFDGLREPSE